LANAEFFLAGEGSSGAIRDKVYAQCNREYSGGAATLDQWYELRVAGSAGTSAGAATGALEGIAVGENGRLCSLTSGGARRFDSKQQATDYLGKIKVSGDYQFEAVLCRGHAAASGAPLSNSRPASPAHD
jgi:hypothetical protein